MALQWALPGAQAALAGTPMPTTWFVQTHTADPGVNGTSNLSADGRRMEVAMAAPSGGVALNAAEEEVSNWGATEDLTHFSLWSAGSGGTCWFIADMGDVSITATEVLTLAVGQLSVALPLWGS